MKIHVKPIVAGIEDLDEIKIGDITYYGLKINGRVVIYDSLIKRIGEVSRETYKDIINNPKSFLDEIEKLGK